MVLERGDGDIECRESCVINCKEFTKKNVTQRTLNVIFKGPWAQLRSLPKRSECVMCLCVCGFVSLCHANFSLMTSGCDKNHNRRVLASRRDFSLIYFRAHSTFGIHPPFAGDTIQWTREAPMKPLIT